jgi:hypothetical protein
VTLQVKLSKDFLVTHMQAEFQKNLRACGWWSINADKLRKSPTDLWVFVLLGFERRTTDFIIIPPKVLLRHLRFHGPQKIIQTYFWVTEQNRCWEARGLLKEDQRQIAHGTYKQQQRDFTRWLNTWDAVPVQAHA